MRPDSHGAIIEICEPSRREADLAYFDTINLPRLLRGARNNICLRELIV